jgi:RNA polymerase sigma-70 factor, ECF subfamily
MHFPFFFNDPAELRDRSDEELIVRCGDEPQCFEELVRRYEAAFMRKAQGIVGSREDAEDAVQEAFLRIYQYADRYRLVPGATFKSWAYRILLNTVFTRYQKLKRARERTAPIGSEYYEVLPDTESMQFARLEGSEYVISVLARLPDTFARILRLYFLEDRSQKEIARIEGVSVGAVKTRMHRAKLAFKRAEESMR